MSESDLRILKLIALENAITITVCCILVLGLYYMGAGGHSFWGLAILMNISTISRKDTIKHEF